MSLIKNLRNVNFASRITCALKLTLIMSVVLGSNVFSAPWQYEFTGPFTNELPLSNGVAIDEFGFTHVQAFNRQPNSSAYFLAHTYSLNAQGQTPWIWGLNNVDRMSDCGVAARNGQRLDCFQQTSFLGDEHKLVLRSNSQNVWSTVIPGHTRLLNFSITDNNTALVVFKNERIAGSILTVASIQNGNLTKLIEAPFCEGANVWLSSTFQMPKNLSDPVLQLKSCGNSAGTELSLSTFDVSTALWTTQTNWFVPSTSEINHVALNEAGKAFAVLDTQGMQHLLSTHQSGTWNLYPLALNPVQDLLVNNEKLVLISARNGAKIYGPSVVTWIDVNSFFAPITREFPELESRAIQGMALSSDNQLIIASEPNRSRERQATVISVDQQGGLNQIWLPYNRDESRVGKTYVFGGPNQVALIARSIQSGGNTTVRVNQLDLPSSK
jgi:hypothetical protein